MVKIKWERKNFTNWILSEWYEDENEWFPIAIIYYHDVPHPSYDAFAMDEEEVFIYDNITSGRTLENAQEYVEKYIYGDDVSNLERVTTDV